MLAQEADNSIKSALYSLKHVLNFCLRRHPVSNSSKLNGVGCLEGREIYFAFFFLLFSHIQSYGFWDFCQLSNERVSCWFCSIFILICNTRVSHQSVPLQADFGGLLKWFDKHFDYWDSIWLLKHFSEGSDCLEREFFVGVRMGLDTELGRIPLVVLITWQSWYSWNWGEKVFFKSSLNIGHNTM